MSVFFNDLKFRMGRRTPYLLCFFAGLGVGTFLANFLYPSFAREAAYYLELLDKNVDLNKGESMKLFGQVFRQRLIQVGLAWLVGLTAYGPLAFCLFAAGLGFSVSFVLSVITVQKGLMGLPVFFMTIMPHALCYLPLWGILFLWAVEKGRRFRLPAFFLLLALTAAGSACETWLNPFFLKLVL